MTTDARLAANRLNALRSTGPRTEAGKVASRRNALTHGLTAKALLLEGEDEVDLEVLKDRLRHELQPRGAIADELLERLASAMWRLRRVPSFEAAMHRWAEHQLGAKHDTTMAAVLDPFETDAQSLRRPFGDGDAKAPVLRLGRTLDAMISRGDVFAKLNRHEAHLWRQVKELLAELRAMKEVLEEVVQTSDASS